MGKWIQLNWGRAGVDARKFYRKTTFLFINREVNSKQFKNWLKKQGCIFEAKKKGSGQLIVRLGRKKSELPMHGGKKQLGTGLMNKIKKDLGLK